MIDTTDLDDDEIMLLSLMADRLRMLHSIAAEWARREADAVNQLRNATIQEMERRPPRVVEDPTE